MSVKKDEKQNINSEGGTNQTYTPNLRWKLPISDSSGDETDFDLTLDDNWDRNFIESSVIDHAGEEIEKNINKFEVNNLAPGSSHDKSRCEEFTSEDIKCGLENENPSNALMEIDCPDIPSDLEHANKNSAWNEIIDSVLEENNDLSQTCKELFSQFVEDSQIEISENSEMLHTEVINNVAVNEKEVADINLGYTGNNKEQNEAVKEKDSFLEELTNKMQESFSQVLLINSPEKQTTQITNSTCTNTQNSNIAKVDSFHLKAKDKKPRQQIHVYSKNLSKLRSLTEKKKKDNKKTIQKNSNRYSLRSNDRRRLSYSKKSTINKRLRHTVPLCDSQCDEKSQLRPHTVEWFPESSDCLKEEDLCGGNKPFPKGSSKVITCRRNKKSIKQRLKRRLLDIKEEIFLWINGHLQLCYQRVTRLTAEVRSATELCKTLQMESNSPLKSREVHELQQLCDWLLTQLSKGYEYVPNLWSTNEATSSRDEVNILSKSDNKQESTRFNEMSVPLNKADKDYCHTPQYSKGNVKEVVPMKSFSNLLEENTPNINVPQYSRENTKEAASTKSNSNFFEENSPSLVLSDTENIDLLYSIDECKTDHYSKSLSFDVISDIERNGDKRKNSAKPFNKTITQESPLDGGSCTSVLGASVKDFSHKLPAASITENLKCQNVADNLLSLDKDSETSNHVATLSQNSLKLEIKNNISDILTHIHPGQSVTLIKVNGKESQVPVTVKCLGQVNSDVANQSEVQDIKENFRCNTLSYKFPLQHREEIVNKMLNVVKVSDRIAGVQVEEKSIAPDSMSQILHSNNCSEMVTEISHVSKDSYPSNTNSGFHSREPGVSVETSLSSDNSVPVSTLSNFNQFLLLQNETVESPSLLHTVMLSNSTRVYNSSNPELYHKHTKNVNHELIQQDNAVKIVKGDNVSCEIIATPQNSQSVVHEGTNRKSTCFTEVSDTTTKPNIGFSSTNIENCSTISVPQLKWNLAEECHDDLETSSQPPRHWKKKTSHEHFFSEPFHKGPDRSTQKIDKRFHSLNINKENNTSGIFKFVPAFEKEKPKPPFYLVPKQTIFDITSLCLPSRGEYIPNDQLPAGFWEDPNFPWPKEWIDDIDNWDDW